jgi:hypothetical protein
MAGSQSARKGNEPMNNEDIVHITIDKVIPAPKWRVIRMLTKIWEFSAYVPTIEEATVIKRSRNIVRTKWRIASKCHSL